MHCTVTSLCCFLIVEVSIWYKVNLHWDVMNHCIIIANLPTYLRRYFFFWFWVIVLCYYLSSFFSIILGSVASLTRDGWVSIHRATLFRAIAIWPPLPNYWEKLILLDEVSGFFWVAGSRIGCRVFVWQSKQLYVLSEVDMEWFYRVKNADLSTEREAALAGFLDVTTSLNFK